ncbi:MAG: methyl-accepting chemotaxis protein [Oricola sp.]
MKSLKISTRIYVLTALALLFMAAAVVYETYAGHAMAVAERKAKLADMNATAIAVMADYDARAKAGEMSLDEAKARAQSAIMAMRYGDDGYFWLQGYDGVMISHPIKAALNGQYLLDLEDPTGKKFFQDMIDVVKGSDNSAGFVDYMWPKPGFEEPVQKYSHVAGYKPWGWIVGTGVYADDLQALLTNSVRTTVFTLLAAAVLTLAAAFAIGRSISRPVTALKDVMNEVARNDTHNDVPHTDRGDEIGEMAHALVALRKSVIERNELEQHKDEQQREIESQRRANDEQTARVSAAQKAVVSSLGEALNRLASGDLTFEVGDLGAEYAELRDDFNRTVTQLRSMVSAIQNAIQTIQGGAGEISTATNDLSRRTEQQAAALEETAAALEQITATVNQSSIGASEARDIVANARSEADHSGDVVRNAVAAMGRIEESSRRITEIIAVIDEIAFQTNLLALNAGVEAARAGEAGKGFAVVAEEVRELAQRSATAAKEIKTLIESSAGEVENGVKLVNATGTALEGIAAGVQEISNRIETIATSAREQAIGLQEINVAINEMDKTTQQNAAMVEETTAASHSLAEEAHNLAEMIAQFSTEETRIRRAA